MDRKFRMLVLDDEEKWRNNVKEFLESEDYHIETAEDIYRALELLRDTFFHIAFVDKQMQYGDMSNIEGVELAKTLWRELRMNHATEVIIYTAHPKFEDAQELFTEYEIVDYLEKATYPRNELRARVAQIVRGIQTGEGGIGTIHIHFNPELEILWKDGKTALDAVDKIKVTVLEIPKREYDTDGKLTVDFDKVRSGIHYRTTRVKKDTPLQQRAADELDDLLCRLFFNEKSILVEVRKLNEDEKGHSGAGILYVYPPARQLMIVKYSAVEDINIEISNYEKYVKGTLGGGRATIQYNKSRTPLLGGIVYSFVGVGSQQLPNFKHIYTERDMAYISQVVNEIFAEVCRPWYANLGEIHPVNLTRQYQENLGFDIEQIAQVDDNNPGNESPLKRLINQKGVEISSMRDELSFPALAGRKFKNPFLLLKHKNYVVNTYECVTHGDLNASNIFVDDNYHVWLIDFRFTGNAHVLRDFIQLDTIVRYQLLDGQKATLEERIHLETMLNSVQRLSEVTGLHGKLNDFGNPHIIKAFETVVRIRELAARILGGHEDDGNEYNAGLVYHSLKTLQFFQLNTVQRAHALLSASLLSTHLRE